MKYYMIAGERSGDLHGGNLIKALKQEDAQAQVRGFGGDNMEKEGAEIVLHYKEMAFMGFLEVAMNLHKILHNLKLCKQDILDYKPDVVVLIDYAGFNLKIAKFAKQHGILVYYYISPKVWAWNQKRALKIKANVDRMFAIMPFEKDFYKKYDWEVDYVGNPVVDAINAHEVDGKFVEKLAVEDTSKPLVALLPGSRKQEVKMMLPLMAEVISKFPQYNFVIAAVGNLPSELYDAVKALPNVYFTYDNSYDLLASARSAIVTSGTATLETAVWGVPQVVVYRTSALTYHIIKRLIRVPYISLVNLIADKEVVKELIQADATLENVAQELSLLTEEGEYRDRMHTNYDLLKQTLGDTPTSENAARMMVKYLKPFQKA